MEKKPKKKRVPSIHDEHRERMRVKYLRGDFENFADHEALEFLLFYSVRQKDTNKLAHRLINEFGSLHNLIETSPKEISRRTGLALSTAILINLVVPMYKKYAASKLTPKKGFADIKAVGEYAASLFSGETVECFYLICLDTQQNLICSELISRGTIDGAKFYSRQIVETTIKHHARYVIIAHNHPSSLLAASSEDIDATKMVINALKPIGVEVVDHIIVGIDSFFSFKLKKLI